MTKEEILKQSRKENTGTDEREEQILLKANNLGSTIGLALAMFLCILNEIYDGPESVEFVIWTMFWCRQTTNYIYQAYYLKKKSYWFHSIAVGLAALMCCLAFLKETLGW